MLRKKILEALLKSGYPDGPRTARFPPRLAPRAWARPCWTPWRAHETNPVPFTRARARTRCTSTSTSARALSHAGPAGAFGAPQHVFDLLRQHPERQLAREDVAKVLENIEKQGFHLQMPPGEEYIEHLPEELLRMNDPL